MTHHKLSAADTLRVLFLLLSACTWLVMLAQVDVELITEPKLTYPDYVPFDLEKYVEKVERMQAIHEEERKATILVRPFSEDGKVWLVDTQTDYNALWERQKKAMGLRR